ncbi:MAG: hypothetical protein V7696_05920, partial [Halioglobus sp.]
DNDACTADSCDPATGCVNAPISCEDNDACTADSCDPATGCVNDDINCDDGLVCTVDSCDPATGCVNDLIPADDPDVDPSCYAEGCDTHTRGYWTQHAYESQFVVDEHLEATGMALSVCGEDISTSCPDVKGSRFRGQSGNLEAQCLAAVLNFAVTDQNGGECSGQLEAFDADGRDASDIYIDCCGAQSACTDGSKAEVSACIGVLSAFNESMDTAPLDELDLCDYAEHHEDHGHCSAEGEVCLTEED